MQVQIPKLLFVYLHVDSLISDLFTGSCSYCSGVLVFFGSQISSDDRSITCWKFKNLFKAVISGVLFKLVSSDHLQRQCDGLGFCDVKSFEEGEMHL